MSLVVDWLVLLALLAHLQHSSATQDDFRRPLQRAIQASSIKRNLRGRLGATPVNHRQPAQLINDESPDAVAAARRYWQTLESAATSSMATQANLWRNQLEEMLSNNNENSISNTCSKSLHHFLNSMAGGKQRAAQALDASSKHLPTGLLWGTLAEFGNYDQCIALDGFQYCSIQIKSNHHRPQSIPSHLTLCRRVPNLLLQQQQQVAPTDNSSALLSLAYNSQHFYFSSIRMSLCLPMGCNKRELQLLLSAYLSNNKDWKLANLSAQLKLCQTQASSSASLDTVQECIVWIFGILVGLVLVATLEDVRQSLKEKRRSCVRDVRGGENVTKSWHYQVYQANQHLLACTGSQARVQLNPLVAPQQQDASFNSSTTHSKMDKHIHLDHHQVEDVSTSIIKQTANKKSFLDILRCFSIVSNLEALNRESSYTVELDTRFLHGIKSLTMVWIIFAHSCSLASLEMLSNVFIYGELICASRLLQALLNVNLAATTFYMVAGLTVCLEIHRKCPSLRPILLKSIGINKGQPVNELANVQQHPSSTLEEHLSSQLNSPDGSTSTLAPHKSNRSSSSNSSRSKHQSSHKEDEDPHRAWPKDFKPLNWLLEKHLRSTPSHAAIVALSILMPTLGAGPLWPESMHPLALVCRQNWLSNLLYANNLSIWPVSWDHICLPGSWWLSNEFQFFAVALLLLALLYLEMAKLAAMFAFIIALACTAATFAMILQQDLPPAPPTTLQSTPFHQSIHSLYHEPWPYLPCYLIGLLTGFLLILKGHHQGSLGAAGNILIWLLVPLLLIALLNCLYPWNMGIPVEPLLTGFHGSTFRTLWATCCSWIVYALASRRKCLVSRFLSWQGFCLTSRLTYCTFLVHILVINYLLSSTRNPIDSSILGLIQRFAANLLLSYLAALLLNLLVEQPFIKLQRLLMASASTVASPFQKPSSFSSSCTLSRMEQHCLVSMLKNNANIKPEDQGSVSGGIDGRVNEEIAPSHIPKAPPPPPAQGYSSFSSPKGNNNILMDEKAQLDAEFQRKLAQAIGRGFRIRSKLANSDGTTRISVNRSAQKKWLSPQQVALRSKLELNTFVQGSQSGCSGTSANL